MKPTIRILLVLLLAMGVCFSGFSCGSPKKKPKKRSSSSEKVEEKKKTPPKPVVEEIPVVPVKPPLPQDLKAWGKKDFFRAREEGNDRLDEACALLGAPFENKPSAANAVEILRSILTPLPIPEMPDIPKPVKTEDMEPKEFNRLEQAYKKRIKAEEDKIRNIPKLNSRTIAAIIEILGQNGDDAAWKLMVDLVQRRQTVDDDSDIEKNVVQTILAHPRSNNLDLIFQMITQPSVFLKTAIPLNEERGRRRITPTQVRTMAIEWMKKYSDPEFRGRVTDYLLAHPEDRELKTLAVPFLISGLVGNIQCMHKIYMAPNFLTPVDREKVERLFLNCSAAAFASITNQVSKSGRPSPDDVFKELQMNAYDQQYNDNSNDASNAEDNTEQTAQDDANPESDSDNPASENELPPEGSSSRIEPYVDTQINDSYKLMTFHPEYAIMILDVVWQNDFIARQKQSWEGKMEFKNREDANARFLLALPLVGQRQYWDDYFTSAYQNGPLVIDKIPLMGYMPTDFGLILELKKIKRNVLPPTQQKKPTSSKNSGYNAAKQRQIELQGAWMEFVRQAVKMQMERCANAAAVQKAREVNVDQLKARTPFTIPEGAHVLSEYHMILPNEYTKNLQGIEIDPVEIHYVQFQWDVPAMTIPSKVKYKEATAKMRFNTLRSSDMGSLWFEYTNPECTESFDIRIPVVGQSKEDLKEYPKGPVQVMSIRVRSN